MNNVALLFPGQGSQYVGMGKKFYERYSLVKELFEEANEILGFDLKSLCFEGDVNELTKTENTQPAILTVSVAMFKIFLEETEIKPLFIAGHSLGELSALTCAGAINFADAIKIVRQRGMFMKDAVVDGVGMMAAISEINSDAITQECFNISNNQNIVSLSNYNSPMQTVISGHKEAVLKVCENLKAKGARVIPLKVSAPFHCSLMKPAADRFKTELQKYSFNDFVYPVISNVTALPYYNKDRIVENLSEHLIKPVRWKEVIEYLNSQCVDGTVEIGPQKVLKNLTKKNFSSMFTYSFDDDEDYIKLTNNFTKRQDVENKGRPTVITRCLAIAVCTPNKNWNNDEYHKGVIEPYVKIQKMQEEIENQGKNPTKEQMREALEMLRTVFITKKTSLDEQIERFEQIFSETGTTALFDDFVIHEF